MEEKLTAPSAAVTPPLEWPLEMLLLPPTTTNSLMFGVKGPSQQSCIPLPIIYSNLLTLACPRLSGNPLT